MVLTLPSQLFKSSCVGVWPDQAFLFRIFNQESEHCHIVGEKSLHVSSQSSLMINMFQFVNVSYGGLEKVYKDQFHLFSILEQQEGLISILVLSHYNLSPSFFSIFHGVNRIVCPTHVQERTNNFQAEMNHESYCLFSSKVNSHSFYDPIIILMDEVLNI